MTKILYKAGFLIFALAAAGAVLATSRQLRGDLRIYSMPFARAGTPLDQAITRERRVRIGVKLNPTSWEGHMQMASYAAIQKHWDRAIDELDEAMRYNVPMQALFLRATLLVELERSADAIAAFEDIRSFSPMDRQTCLHLIRLYSMGKDYPKLEELARMMERRWNHSFESLAALGNAEVEFPDRAQNVELAQKYYVLAIQSARKLPERPEPYSFEFEDIETNVEKAARILSSRNYTSTWAAQGQAGRIR